jgi:type II secretion system protein N
MSTSPASRWGTVPDFAELTSADFWRTRRLETAYAAAAVAMFLVVLVATFPYAQTVRAVLEPMGLSVSSTGQHYSFPFGARLDNVRVRSMTNPHAPLLFESESVRIAPSILWTLLLRPGISTSANAYGGTIAISAHRSGSATAVSFSTVGVKMESYGEVQRLGLRFGGTLSGAGSLMLTPDDLAADSGSISMDIAALSVSAPGGGQPVKLGDAHARLSLTSGIVKIEELKNKGGDIAVDGGGTIRLAPDWTQSPLAMRLTLVPTPQARQKLGFLMGLLPHPPGTQPYTLRGTLGAPVFQ